MGKWWEGTGRNRIKETISKTYYVRKKWSTFNKGRKHSEWKRPNGGEFGQVVGRKIITQWLQISLKVWGAVVQPEGCENREMGSDSGPCFSTELTGWTDRAIVTDTDIVFSTRSSFRFTFPTSIRRGCWDACCGYKTYTWNSSKVLNSFVVPSWLSP